MTKTEKIIKCINDTIKQLDAAKIGANVHLIAMCERDMDYLVRLLCKTKTEKFDGRDYTRIDIYPAR